MHRMLRVVKEISRVLSGKCSKYSVVGTKTKKKKNNEFSIFADSKGHLRISTQAPVNLKYF